MTWSFINFRTLVYLENSLKICILFCYIKILFARMRIYLHIRGDYNNNNIFIIFKNIPTNF